jgi:hypothetical protein
MRAAPQHTDRKDILYTRCALLQSNRDLSGPNPTQMDLSLCYPQQAPRLRNRKSLTWMLSEMLKTAFFITSESCIEKARNILLPTQFD